MNFSTKLLSGGFTCSIKKYSSRSKHSSFALENHNVLRKLSFFFIIMLFDNSVNTITNGTSKKITSSSDNWQQSITTRNDIPNNDTLTKTPKNI